MAEFLEYLDNLKDMINLFESLNLSTEIMGEMPLTEEQVELTNVYLEKLQEEWSDGFLHLLKLGVKWLKKNKGENMRKIKSGKIDESKFEEFEKIPVIISAYQTDEEVEIETLEGVMKANKGDWIIKGVKGEVYPCKPDVFEMTYKRV